MKRGRGEPKVGADAALDVPGFESLTSIGSGGFARVYSGLQLSTGREVAVKVLSVDLMTNWDAAVFENECKAMAAPSAHPNIVTIFDSVFAVDGSPCIVMELHRGGSLEQVVRRNGERPLDVAKVLQVGVAISGALETVHRQSIFHNDVKPQNVFFSGYGPALGDFGISTFADVTSAAAGVTPSYAPPEAIEGYPSGASGDIYSLAATLYRAASGRRPFDPVTGARRSPAQVVRAVLAEAPAPLPDYLPYSLRQAIMGGLAKDPADRPRSAKEFGEQLQAIETEVGCGPTPMFIPSSEGELEDSTLDVTPDGVLPVGTENTGGTIVHPSQGSDPGPVEKPDEDLPTAGGPDRRLLLSGALLLAVLLGGGMLVWLLGGDGDDPTLTTVTPSVTAANPAVDGDFFYVAPAPPADLQLDRDGPDAVMTWTGDANAASYEVFQLQDDGEPLIVGRTDDTQMTIEDLDPDSRACYRVQAVGESGLIAESVESVCLTEG